MRFIYYHLDYNIQVHIQVQNVPLFVPKKMFLIELIQLVLLK
jgi:hypothetical protein